MSTLFALFIILVCSCSAYPILWAGGVTATSAEFRVESDIDRNFLLASEPDFCENSIVYTTPITNGLNAISVQSLKPLQRYYYAVDADLNYFGEFQTFPPEGQYFSFNFTFGSCAFTGAESLAFEEMNQRHPLLFLHLGDLHYGNVACNCHQCYLNSIKKTWNSTLQSLMFRSTAMAYMYDDHDFGPDDSDASHPGKEAAKLIYHQAFPHYPLHFEKPSEGPLFQAFTVGRVRFILTDLRSECTETQVLGDVQKAWLFEEFSKAKEYAILVWASTKPWIGDYLKDDAWYSFVEERREIANKIAELQIDNLVLLHGDTHYLAADNGSNSDYADNGGAGFPVFCAAPFYHIGTYKAGPYSEGCWANPLGQKEKVLMHYGVVNIVDEINGETCIHYRGFEVGNAEPIVQVHMCRPWVVKGSRTEEISSCATKRIEDEELYCARCNEKCAQCYDAEGCCKSGKMSVEECPQCLSCSLKEVSDEDFVFNYRCKLSCKNSCLRVMDNQTIDENTCVSDEAPAEISQIVGEAYTNYGPYDTTDEVKMMAAAKTNERKDKKGKEKKDKDEKEQKTKEKSDKEDKKGKKDKKDEDEEKEKEDKKKKKDKKSSKKE
jgi:alkaline phosphatase D